jgi:hypothetical protein
VDVRSGVNNFCDVKQECVNSNSIRTSYELFQVEGWDTLSPHAVWPKQPCDQRILLRMISDGDNTYVSQKSDDDHNFFADSWIKSLQ